MTFDVTHEGPGRNSAWYAEVHQAWKEERERPGYQAIPHPKIAERAAKALLRKMLGKARMPRGLVTVITSGNRYNDVRNGNQLILNPSRGWENLVHELSHYTWFRLHRDASPHDPGHAGHELRAARFVIERGYTVMAPPPPKPKPTTAQKRQARVERINELLAAWRTKEKRAQTAIHKLTIERTRLVRAALRDLDANTTEAT